MKHCNQCGKDKPEFEFSLDKKSLDGLQSQCKICQRKYNRKYYQKNKQLERNKHLEREYAMLPGQYEMILKLQNGVCAICFKICVTGRNLAVDHDKQTNKNRGLLCQACNTGIGKLKHDPKLFKQAIKYLEETA